jgi:hypothetical protein
MQAVVGRLACLSLLVLFDHFKSSSAPGRRRSLIRSSSTIEKWFRRMHGKATPAGKLRLALGIATPPQIQDAVELLLLAGGLTARSLLNKQRLALAFFRKLPVEF